MNREDVKQIENYKKQRLKAERKNDLKQEAEYCRYIGDIYTQYADKCDEAIEEYERSLALYEGLNSKIEVGVACRMLGECYSKKGDIEKALKLHNRFLELARACQNSQEEQRALTTLGRTYLDQHDTSYGAGKQVALKKAENAFLQSLNVCKQLEGSISNTECQDMRARLFINLGLVYETKNDLDQSNKYLKQALTLGEKHQLYEVLYLSQVLLAESKKNSDNLGEALRYFTQAAESARKDKNKKNEVAAMENKTMILVQQEEFPAARHLLKKIRQLKTHRGEDVDSVRQTYRTVVKMQTLMGELRRCDNTDFERKIRLHDKLGDSAVDLNIFKQGIGHYQKVLKYSKAVGKSKQDIVATHVSLALTYRDDKQYEKAVEHCRQEIDCRGELEKDQISRSWLNIADIQERAGQSVTIIQQSYVNAYNAAKRGNHRKLQVQSLTSLLELFRVYKEEKLRRKTQAQLDHIREKYQISDSVLEEDSQVEDSSSPEDADDTITNVEEGEEEEENTGEMSDLTESEDDEKVEKVSKFMKVFRSATGRVQKTDISKVNSYGETLLHQACIKGQLEKVKDLISQGHPLNPQDYNGWTPLHEAANHNHYEITEYLLKHGANVNDRGGQGCRGTTPLIDAASNGVIQIMELLIKHGANVIAKDDDQKTALDHFVEFRDTDEGRSMTHDQEVLYRNMVQKLRERGVTRTNRTGLSRLTSSALVPSTESRPAASKRKRSYEAFVDQDSSSENETEEEIGVRTSRNKVLSDTDSMETNSDDFFLNPRLQGLDEDRCATDTYRNAISSVGQSASRSSQKGKQGISQRKSKPKKPALLHDDAVVDDWLEDDMQPIKRQKVNGYFTSGSNSKTSSRNADSSTNSPQRGSASQKKRRKIESDSDSDNEDTIYNNDLDEGTVHSNSDSERLDIESVASESEEDSLRDITNISSSADRGHVIDNTHEGVDYLFVDSDLDDLPLPVIQHDSVASKARKPNKQKQLKLTDFGQRTTQPSVRTKNTFPTSYVAGQFTQIDNVPRPSQGEAIVSSREKLSAGVIRVKVQVQDKLLLIPVVDNDGPKTFGWLAEEASNRYYKLSGLRPSLTLAKDGAHFSSDDLVSLLLADNDKIEGNLQSWDLPPIAERYSGACKTLNSVVYRNVSTLLQLCETTGQLSLKDLSLKTSRFQPIITALQCQNNLRELDATGNHLGDVGVENLCKVLTSLPNLCTLVLACNDITVEGLKHLNSLFTVTADKPLQQLSVLDLSHNPLYDSSLVSMATLIANLPSLTCISVSSCHMTVKLFERDRLRLTEALHKSSLQTFDISYNNLGCVGVELFLKCQRPQHLVTLNLTATLTQGSSQLYRHLYNYMSQDGCVVQELILRDCHLGVEDSDFLIRLPVVAKRLQKLDLSCNPRLTNQVLQQLLVSMVTGTSRAEELIMMKCGLQSPLDVELLDALSEKLSSETSLRKLEFTCSKMEKIDVESITQVWREQWEDNSDIVCSEGYVKLGVLAE